MTHINICWLTFQTEGLRGSFDCDEIQRIIGPLLESWVQVRGRRGQKRGGKEGSGRNGRRVQVKTFVMRRQMKGGRKVWDSRRRVGMSDKRVEG